MQYRQAPFGYFLVLDRGDEVLEGITRFATETGVRAANFAGSGAIDRLTLGFYDLLAQVYRRRSWDEDFEIASLIGNIAVVDGGPDPHVHGVFCRRVSTASSAAEISPWLEDTFSRRSRRSPSKSPFLPLWS
jgi:predicted DNA-binding protein with PD1-like motif